MKKRLTLFLVVVLLSSGVVAQTSKRRAVRVGLPTSEELIDAAMRSGRISDETALEYRAFAAFGDCRLPAQFRGDDKNVPESAVLNEIAARWSTLSPGVQAVLQPYLLEPYATGGWYQVQQTVCGAGVTPSDLFVKTITILGGKVRVVYDSFLPGEEAAAQQVSAALESSIYPKLTALMQREPLPYDPTGKDPLRLSVSILDSVVFGNQIVEGIASFEQQPPLMIECNHGPGFVEVNARARDLPVTAAHEFMHVLQFAYPVATTCNDAEYEWISEATATWAQDYVYPFSDDEHQFAGSFLHQPELPLEHTTGDLDLHMYGAYLLPFFVHRQLQDPDFVRRIWVAAGSKLSLPAVDDALGPHGGFKEEWPEFALRNWNHPPYDDYQIEDRLTTSATQVFDFSDALPEHKFNISTFDTPGSLAIQPLSAQYFHYNIQDSVRTIAFVNGLNFKLGVREWSFAPDFGKNFMLDNASNPRDGLKIQALLKINGSWEQTPRDWTQRPFVAFCREFPAEHVDELVLIVSNSEYKQRDPIQPEGMLPAIWTSNMSCAGWKTEKATFQDENPPVKLSWDATFRRSNDLSNVDAMPTLPLEGVPVLYYLYTGSGTVTWGFDNSSGPCTYSGSGTISLDGSVFATWNFSPPEATMHRAYMGVMKTASDQVMHYTETCGQNSDSYDLTVPGWAVFPSYDIRRVSNDGITIHDQNALSLDTGTSDWTMKAIPP
jgi:hypothetical protein